MRYYNALEHVIENKKGMRLSNWSKEVVIRAQFPDDHSKMTHPYLYVESRYGRVPWVGTFPEIFSEEWNVIE